MSAVQNAPDRPRSNWLPRVGSMLVFASGLYFVYSNLTQGEQQAQRRADDATRHETAELQQEPGPPVTTGSLPFLQPNPSLPSSPVTLGPDEDAVATRLVSKVERLAPSTSLDQFHRQLSDLPRHRKQKDELVQLVRLCADAIWHTYHVHPYRVQLYAVMRMLLSGSPDASTPQSRGALAQVRTGEGKSMINVMVAAAMALQERRVHCMSSSVLLSQRDFGHAHAYFKLLRISHASIVARPIGSVLSTEQEQAQILFGTPNCFQFYYLDQGLLHISTPTCGPAQKLSTDVVILDEVDDLLLDRYNSLPVFSGTPLEPWASEAQLRIIARLGQQHHSRNNVADINMEAFQRDVAIHTGTASMPERRRKQLCLSYVTAHQYVPGVDYVVQPLSHYMDRLPNWEPNLDEVPLLEGSVVIVCKDSTGELAPKSRWSFGVHEFLEIRHRLPVQAISTYQAQSVHTCYLRQYVTLIGMSGTLGSQSERAELAKTFEVSTFDVPRNRVHQLQRREDLLLLGTQGDLFEAVAKRALEERRKHRPVLIICESIAAAKSLMRVLYGLVGRLSSGVKLITGEQFWYMCDGFERAGEPGRITVTTVIGGRGIDIKLAARSKANGGLHVILTFSPASQRVEEQCTGRAARQGEPGSAQMIVCVPEGFSADQWSRMLIESRAVNETAASVRRAACLQLGKLSWQFQQRYFDAMQEYANRLVSRLRNLPLESHRRCIEHSQTWLGIRRSQWSDLMDELGLTSIESSIEKPDAALASARVASFLQGMRD